MSLSGADHLHADKYHADADPGRSWQAGVLHYPFSNSSDNVGRWQSTTFFILLRLLLLLRGTFIGLVYKKTVLLLLVYVGQTC